MSAGFWDSFILGALFFLVAVSLLSAHFETGIAWFVALCFRYAGTT